MLFWVVSIMVLQKMTVPYKGSTAIDHKLSTITLFSCIYQKITCVITASF